MASRVTANSTQPNWLNLPAEIWANNEIGILRNLNPIDRYVFTRTCRAAAIHADQTLYDRLKTTVHLIDQKNELTRVKEEWFFANLALEGGRKLGMVQIKKNAKGEPLSPTVRVVDENKNPFGPEFPCIAPPNLDPSTHHLLIVPIAGKKLQENFARTNFLEARKELSQCLNYDVRDPQNKDQLAKDQKKHSKLPEMQNFRAALSSYEEAKFSRKQIEEEFNTLTTKKDILSPYESELNSQLADIPPSILDKRSRYLSSMEKIEKKSKCIIS